MQKNKMILFSLTVLVLLSLGASGVQPLSRLTVVNKSGMKIAISMTGAEEEETYYLSVASGSKDDPTTREFTVIKDTYSAKVYYLETYDPVYGYSCSGGAGGQLSLTKNGKLVVNSCESSRPFKHGEKRRSQGKAGVSLDKTEP